MTISRKEYNEYAKAFGAIRDMTDRVRRAEWWRGSYKSALLHDIDDVTNKLECALIARISKPRPRGNHDA